MPRRARIHGGIDGPHTLDGRVHLRLATLRVELVEQLLELLHRLFLAIVLRELVCEHEPDVVLIRAEFRKFLQCTKGFVRVAGLLHTVGILEKVLLRVALESLLRADLSELVIHERATRRLTQDLGTDRDRIVEEAAFRILVDGLLVVIHRVADVAETQVEVTHTIIEPYVLVFRVGSFFLVEDLDIQRKRLIELFLLLEFSGFFLISGDLRHQAGGKERQAAGTAERAARTGRLRYC